MAKQSRFHLPWHQTTPEEKAAKEAAAQERATLREQLDELRRAEALRREADLQSLAQGGIPTMAAQRLSEIRGADPEQSTFSSDLSPDEAALLRRNGYRPLGLVSGSAMYHVGSVYPPAYGSARANQGNTRLFPALNPAAYRDGELTTLSGAYNEATRLAVSRMQQEATAIGAFGVVGVRYTMARRVWGLKSIEVRLLGTAVAGPDRPPAAPWLSDLSGQEWYALHRAGYDPVGLVYGHCAWLILTTQLDAWTAFSGRNQELAHWSDALRQCRNRANGAVYTMARDLQAVGVVGMHLTRRLEEFRFFVEGEHHILTLHLIGTAVRLRPDAPKTIRATGNVLSLRDGRIRY